MVRRSPTRYTPSPSISLEDPNGEIAVYADMYLVATDKEAGLVTVSFYQSLFEPGGEASYGTVAGVNKKKARCVSRVILSEKGRDTLLKALQDNMAAVAKIEKPKVADKAKS
jgi:hypothetical protein